MQNENETKRKKAERPKAARPQAFFCEESKSKSAQHQKYQKIRKTRKAINQKSNINNDKTHTYKSNRYE